MKTTRASLVLTSAVFALAVSGCGSPSSTTEQAPPPADDKVVDLQDKTDYTEIRYSRNFSEIHFTDSDGTKMKCFLYSTASSAGLDGCQRVG